MKKADAERLATVIRSQHGASARYQRSVQVMPNPADPRLWDGLVHVFELKGHPEARRAYAWSAPIDGVASARFFAVLHQGRITGPLEAVRAASGLIQKARPILIAPEASPTAARAAPRSGTLA